MCCPFNCVLISSVVETMVLCIRQANRALTIDVRTHRFLDMQSPNKSSRVGTQLSNPRSTHDAIECEGGVDSLWGEGDDGYRTLLSERSLSSELSSSESVRTGWGVGAGFRSTERGPLEFGITFDCTRDCPTVV